jgi:hypothetical protein
MKLPWIRVETIVEPRTVINAKAQELQTAKEILAEVFRIHLSEINDMLLKRLKERGGNQEHQDCLWPTTFCVGD